MTATEIEAELKQGGIAMTIALSAFLLFMLVLMLALILAMFVKDE